MDDSWSLKCAAGWQPQAALPPASTSVRPTPMLAPVVAPSQVLAPGTGGSQLCYPFAAQETQLDIRAFTQDSAPFNTSNLGHHRQDKAEQGNSFLALLSGPSHHLQNEYSQLPNSRRELPVSKPSVNTYGVIGASSSFGVPVSHVASMGNYHGSSWGIEPEVTSFVASTSEPQSTCSQAHVLNNNLQTPNSLLYSSNSWKSAGQQTFHGNGTGATVSSQTYGLNADSTHASAGLCHYLNVQFSPRLSVEVKSTVSDHTPAYKRGGPRVFCMGTVGELFLNEKGLFGVICLCHSSCMSVAKFCEHSGSLLRNPGEVVRLENGETIARWRKLFFLNAGIRVPDDDNGWDWPDCSFLPSGLVGTKVNNPISPKIYESSPALGPFDGLGKPGKVSNGYTSSDQQVGHDVLETLVNRISRSAPQKNAMENQNSFLKSCIGSSNNSLLQPSNDSMMQAAKEDHGCNQLFSHPVKTIGKCGNQYILPGTVAFKTFGGDFSASRDVIPNKAHFLDTTASNFELSLGQPSRQSRVCVGSITASMQPYQFEQLFNSEKPPMQEFLSPRSYAPPIGEEPRQNVSYAPSDNLTSSRTAARHSHGSMSSFHPPEAEVYNGEQNKGSTISLFLSHLNTFGGDAPSKAADNVLINSDSSVPNVLNFESYAECNSSLSRKVAVEVEGASKMNRADFSHQMDKVKNVEFSSGDLFNSLQKPNNLFQNKHASDFSVLAEAIDGCSHQNIPAMLDRRASSHSHQCSRMPVEQTDSWNSKQFGKRFWCENRENHELALLKFMDSVSSSCPKPSSHSSPSSAKFSSSNPVHISDSIPPFTSKMSMNVCEHILDENTRFLTLKHMPELSKQKCATSSLDRTPQQGRIRCPLAMEMQGNISKEDAIALVGRSQGAYCNIGHGSSKSLVKSLLPCPNCESGGGNQNSTGKSSVPGISKCCHHTASMQGIPLCSGGCSMQSSPCLASCADEPHLLRLRRIENNGVDSLQCELGNQKILNNTIHVTCKSHGTHNDKEQRNRSCERCGCHIHSKCISEYCFSRDGSQTDVFKEQTVSGNIQKLYAPAFSRDCILQEGRSELDRCEGLRNLAIMDNDFHSTMWRDVPRKFARDSDVNLIEKPKEIFQATETVVGLTESGIKEIDGAFVEVEAVKEHEHQISNIYSGCSAPAVTEVSVEGNNMESCNKGAGDGKLMHSIVDEGSGIEKCASSDGALDSGKWDEAFVANGKVDLLKELHGMPYQLPDSAVNELTCRDLFKCKKSRYRCQRGKIINDNKEHEKRVQKAEKRKKTTTKWKKLDASNSGLSPVHYVLPGCNNQPEQHMPLYKGTGSPLQPGNEMENAYIHATKTSSFKRKRSALTYGKIPSTRRYKDHSKELEDDHIQSTDETVPNKMSNALPSKKAKKIFSVDGNQSSLKQDDNIECAVKHPKYISLSATEKFSSNGTGPYKKKVKPVVCGDSGIISSGDLYGESRPVKIVSLSVILKTARKTIIFEKEQEFEQTYNMVKKKARFITNNGISNYFATSEEEQEDKIHGCDMITMSRTDNGFSANNEPSLMDTERSCGSFKTFESAGNRKPSKPKMKRRCKEIRKRSLGELTGKSKHADSTVNTSVAFPGNILGSRSPESCPSVANARNSQDHTFSLSHVNARKFSCKGHRCQPSLINSDAFCCVCGSSNKDDTNCLIECSQCLIRVHQACYGVSKVPKGRWCCRPCRTNAKNIACVLCGYKGGAMTRAVKSRIIVKSLLKAWKIETGYKPVKAVPSSENPQDVLGMCSKSIDEAPECEGCVSAALSRPMNSESRARTSLKMDLRSCTVLRESEKLPAVYGVQNSITAGLLDPSVTQWVHMVCGLWTPGTRCPNVDTMSAFDVSGAISSRKNMVCSMCSRPGGSCIQCRVLNCSAYFHPWCAHQKGLLQSEIEGADDENVGFYGRCLLHASHQNYNVDTSAVEIDGECHVKKEFSCARTEGYKGHKKDEGFDNNLRNQSNESGGCIVPQEQINAWLHINGQKSCTRGLVRPPASDTEYECRKEYARYKQGKGWKHLVVYKSGIHALGLYTSRFIARGAMVVEYVGEIVGLRVADKREIEYQSGCKLQYKSACYFFRIDKESIIDATRKGGIARFVNHSCLPNCVAKVISVRNEKKVVFFAERDINPGEEITYDYHFNHEDEGEKIPCFCKSKNCRRNLN